MRGNRRRTRRSRRAAMHEHRPEHDAVRDQRQRPDRHVAAGQQQLRRTGASRSSDSVAGASVGDPGLATAPAVSANLTFLFDSPDRRWVSCCATPRRGCVRAGSCSARHSSPPSPTSIPAMSRPTSARARSSASCWCGSSSWPTPWRDSSSTCRPNSDWSAGARCPRPSPTTPALRPGSPTGCRPNWSPWQPISPRSSAAPSRCTCCSTCRCWSAASSPARCRCCCSPCRTAAANGCSSG